MNTTLILAYVGVALMVGLAGIASAVGTAICGQAAVGSMKKNGSAFGSYMRGSHHDGKPAVDTDAVPLSGGGCAYAGGYGR